MINYICLKSTAATASSSSVEDVKDKEIKTISLPDLPQPILESILERLSPADLCNMIEVCTFFRAICTSDHLWEKHLKRKWGKLIGDAAYRKWIGDIAYQEWQFHVASWNAPKLFSRTRRRRILRLNPPPDNSQQLSSTNSSIPRESCKAGSTSLPVGSVMAFYLALESGKFWFPAQVFYGGSGSTGDMLLCYDAQVSYDYKTDTFRARYPSDQVWGRKEANVKWDRIRAPPVDTPPFLPHVSDCLHDLKPGDHIEIQWKSHEKLPYGWWYALIGHLDDCNGNMNHYHCHCHESDTLVVEFNQYPPGSVWRRTMIKRTRNPGEGNGVDQLYGGIRKLTNEEEISKWLRFLPSKSNFEEQIANSSRNCNGKNTKASCTIL